MNNLQHDPAAKAEETKSQQEAAEGQATEETKTEAVEDTGGKGDGELVD